MIVFSANPVMGTNNLSPSLNPDLVSWKSLTYKAKTFFGKATAVIELNFCCQPDLHGQIDNLPATSRDYTFPRTDEFCLSVTDTIKPYFSTNRFYQTKVWFSAKKVMAIRRLRLLRGKKYYLKDYVFTPAGVYRYRQEPADAKEEATKPELWSDTEKTFYPLPGNLSPKTIVSEPSLLLYYLAANVLESGTQPKEICVFHKKQYHMVTLAKKAPIRIQVEYTEQQNGQSKLVKKGEMELVSYRLISQPVKENDGTAAEKFSFMGLTGEISIYFDEKSRIPMRINGDIPLIGQVHFNLKQVVRRDRK